LIIQLRLYLLEWLPWLLMMRRPGRQPFSRQSMKKTAIRKLANETSNNINNTPFFGIKLSDSMSLIRSIKVDETKQQTGDKTAKDTSMSNHNITMQQPFDLSPKHGNL
jgi:hypothetical protein